MWYGAPVSPLTEPEEGRDQTPSGHFPAPEIWAVDLKLQSPQESPGAIVKLETLGPHSLPILI